VKAETLLANERERLPQNLHLFIQRAWHTILPPRSFVDNWHIACISEHLQDVTNGVYHNLVINIPPACMKTLTVSVFWPVWEWLSKPNSSFISASFDGTRVLQASRDSMRIIEHPWFQKRWDIKLAGKVPAATEYKIRVNGVDAANQFSRFSTSLEGKLTGRHCTHAIVDDPLKPQTVSKVTLEKCEKWWRESLQTRFKATDPQSIVVIMQRLHHTDLSAVAINAGYQHLNIPMRWERAAYSIPDRDSGWALEAASTYGKDGDLLWPELFPESKVAALEKDMGARATAAQFQQRPTPEGGGIFRTEHMQHWHPSSLPPRFDKMCISVDAAFRATEDSDYVAIGVWGKKGADAYLLDQYRQRATFSETVRALLAMIKKWPKATHKYIEAKANGDAIVDMLKRKVPGIVAVDPEGGKESRANRVSYLFESLNVWLPPADVAPWVEDFKLELLSFPMGAHDDQVDQCTQALNRMYAKTSIHAAMENLRKDGVDGWFGSTGGGFNLG
jgi:predicted phage terminase large subunit-like protein